MNMAVKLNISMLINALRKTVYSAVDEHTKRLNSSKTNGDDENVKDEVR